MKLCYAPRRGVFYPSTQDLFGTMPQKEHRAGYLKLVKSYGFDGVEIPAASQAEIDAGTARDFGQELKDAGLPALCVRAGGPIAHHTAGGMSRYLEHLAELQPEMFVEVSPALAAERGLEHMGWCHVITARSAPGRRGVG